VDHESRLRLEAARSRTKVLARQTTEVSSFSFPKTRRLTHRSEYERVKRNGVTQRGKLLMLNAVSTENSGSWRAGFVTSARLGGAVIRNRVRRRLREIVRRHQHELRQGIWFVIIARYEAAAASYDALEDEWLRLARRASILL
jgi:ribonuclease P protein component